MVKDYVNLIVELVGVNDAMIEIGSIEILSKGEESSLVHQEHGRFWIKTIERRIKVLASSSGYESVEVEIDVVESEPCNYVEQIERIHLKAISPVTIVIGNTEQEYAALPEYVTAYLAPETIGELKAILETFRIPCPQLPDAKHDKDPVISPEADYLKDYRQILIPKSAENSAAVYEAKEDKDIARIRKQKGVLVAGPVLGLTQEGPIILLNWASVVLNPWLKADEIQQVFAKMGVKEWERDRGEGNLYRVSFGDDVGLGILQLIEAMKQMEGVVTAEPELGMTAPMELIVPNDFLWSYTWDRNQHSITGNAWQALRNAQGVGPPDMTYGNSDVIIGIMDEGVLTNGGVPDNPDFQGTVSDTASTNLTAAVATAPRAIITVASTVGISVGDRIHIGRGEDRYKLVHSVNAGLNQLTIDPLYFDHAGMTAVIDNATNLVVTRLAAVGATATTTNLSVATIVGFRVGQSVALRAQGNANVEDVVITALAAGTMTVRGLRGTHPNGTVVQSGRKVYKTFDFDAGNFVANNDATPEMHGTSCAGIALATGNNGIGSAGMAPNARLLSGRVTTLGTDPLRRDAFYWAAGLMGYSTTANPRLPIPGVDVLSVSLGYNQTMAAPTLVSQTAISMVTRRGRNGRGLLLFMSAGNDDRPQPAGRWSAHPNAFSISSSWLAQYPAVGAGAIYVKEGRVFSSNYTVNVAVGADPVDIEFSAMSGYRGIPAPVIPAPPPWLNLPLARAHSAPHNPPISHWIVTTSFSGRGNVPSSSAGIATATAATPAHLGLTQITASVLQGATSLTVNSIVGFAMGDWICLGQWTDTPANRIQWLQINGVPAGVTIPVTAVPFDHPIFVPIDTTNTSFSTVGLTAAASGNMTVNVPWANRANFLRNGRSIVRVAGVSYRVTGMVAAGVNVQLAITPPTAAAIPGGTGISIIGSSQDNLENSSVVTVNSTAGFVANSWVLVGNPGTTNCASSYVHAVINAVTMRITGPLNPIVTLPVATQIHRGPLDYYNRMNGTSAAAPNAAGIGALLLSANQNLTWLEIRDIMRSTAVKIDVGNAGFLTVGAFGNRDGVTGPNINIGQWIDAGLNPIINVATGNIFPVGAADAIAAGFPAAQGATTITVTNGALFAVGQAIQIGANPFADFSTIFAIAGNVLTIEPLIQPRAAGTPVQGGRIPWRSGWYGAGRLDPVAAVTAALAYSHDSRDLMIRNFLGDDGVNPTNPAVNPIISPDIFLRNANDIVGGVPLNYNQDGPHQNPANGLSAPVFAGAGLNDFRMRGYFTGAAVTSYVVAIDGNGPDTFRWSSDGGVTFPNTLVPIVANAPTALSNGVIVTWGANAGHTIGDQWSFTGTPTNHFIHVRVRNRGNALPSLPGCYVRFYVALTNGNLIGNGQTPFYFPQGWNDSVLISGAINGNTESGIYLVPNPLPPVLAGLGDNPPNNTPCLDPTTWAANTNIAQNSDRTYACTWLSTDVPPSTIDLRMFLLAEVLPHDGVLGGLSPDINNNVSYREIFFGNAYFLDTGTNATPATTLEVDNIGTPVTLNFSGNMQADLGQFRTEDLQMVISRRDTTGAVANAVYSYDGAVWGFAGGAPAWGAMTPPTLTGTATLAAGNQGEVTFTGSVTVTNGFDLVTLTVQLKGVHSAIIFEKKLDITVFAEPVLLPSPDNGISPAETPRLHEFADMLLLTAQTSAAQAFGPDPGNNPTTLFRITSTFVNAAPVKAYAAMRGFVFVQRVDNDRVNLILKPLEQTGMGFTPVKYYVYRGLALPEFLLGTSALDERQVCARAGASDFIESVYATNDAINAASGQPPEGVLPKAFGWDPDAQTDPQAYLDDYFYQPDSSIQLAVAEKGMYLGHFVGNGVLTCGFEVVLQDSRSNLTLAYARATHHEITIAGGLPALQDRAERDAILGWVDPAALYGMHYFAGVVQAVNGVQKKKDMYDKILAPFFNKNRVYLDVRNETAYSMNYYGNYQGTVAGPDQFHQIKLGDSVGAMTSQAYSTSSWPLIWVDASPTNTSKVNLKFLSLRFADNVTPLLFSQHGELATTHVRARFVEGPNLMGTDTQWTKEVGISYPNYNSTGLNVATWLKLYYFRQLPSPPGNTTVVPTTDFTDNIFTSLELLIRERPITGVNTGTHTFTVNGDFSGGIDAGDKVAVVGSPGAANDLTYTVVSATVALGATNVVVVEAIPSGAVGGLLQFNYSQWTTGQPTRWFSGVEKHYVDAVLAPVDGGGAPLLAIGMVGEAGAAVENARVILYLSPYHFFKDNSPIRTVNRINLQAGVGLESSFWTEIQNQNPNLKLSATILVIGGTEIPVFEFDELSTTGGPDMPENFMALCVSDAEFVQIRQSINEHNFSTYHTRSIGIVLAGAGAVADDNGVMYRSYDVHLRGWDAAGNYQQVSSATVGIPTAVKVYTLDSSRMIYATEDFSNLENLTTDPDQTEENRRIQPAALSLLASDPTTDSLIGSFNSSLSGITNDKAAIENLVETTARALFVQGVDLNELPAYDDRPLYWARLHMRAAVRVHPWIRKQRKRIRELVDLIETKSRGYDAVDFTSGNPAWISQGVNFGIAKKVLVTGFDPFDLDVAITVTDGLNTSNPAGICALHLHDQRLTDGLGNEAMVQSMVFPVRYREFDKNLIENLMKKYLEPGSPDQVDMVITLSQNGDLSWFYLERFASRFRGGGSENENVTKSPTRIGFGASWDEFFNTTLPVALIVPNPGVVGQTIFYNQGYKSSVGSEPDVKAVGGVNVNTNTVAFPNGQAENGSGGSYLYNEVFYRMARLREKLSSTVKTGHLHIPAAHNAGMTIAAIVTEVENVVKRALAGI